MVLGVAARKGQNGGRRKHPTPPEANVTYRYIYSSRPLAVHAYQYPSCDAASKDALIGIIGADPTLPNQLCLIYHLIWGELEKFWGKGIRP